MSLLEIFGNEPFKDVFFDEFGVDVCINVCIDQEGEENPLVVRGILEAPGEEIASGAYATTTWSLILRTSDFVNNSNYENYTINRGQRITIQKKDCNGEIIDGSVKRFIITSTLITELPDGATARISLEADNCQE